MARQNVAIISARNTICKEHNDSRKERIMKDVQTEWLVEWKCLYIFYFGWNNFLLEWKLLNSEVWFRDRISIVYLCCTRSISKLKFIMRVHSVSLRISECIKFYVLSDWWTDIFNQHWILGENFLLQDFTWKFVLLQNTGWTLSHNRS